jgi:4-amino-4-deoxy-L-arabinose transferase-like glycosyltransferase
MIQNNDWIWPTCNGEARLNKTPLPYWLVASFAKVTGMVDEFTTRFPGALSGCLSVITILYFLNRLLGFRIAVISACVWATSVNYIRYSHNARPEMLLTFFTVLSFLSFYAGINETERKRQIIYILIFWVSFGLGMLAKGPTPLLIIVPPLFVYFVVYKKWKMIPKLLPVIGAIIFIAIVAPWPLAIAQKLNWDLTLWKVEFVDRFFGEYDSGGKPLYYYFPRMFIFIAPWSAFVAMALVAPFYKVWNKKRNIMMFLWLWFVVGFVFFTINGGKRHHYILPLMPAMAMLIGIILEDMAFERKAYTLKFAQDTLKAHVGVIIFIAICAPVAVLFALRGETENVQFSIYTLILGAITAIMAVAASYLFKKKSPEWACASIFTGILMLFMVGLVIFSDPLDKNRFSRAFSRKVAQIIPSNKKLLAYANVSNRTVQYYGKVVPEIPDIEQLYEHYKQGDWVVATSSRMDTLETDGRFRMVYFKEKAERSRQDDVAGALYHITAKKVEHEK